MSKKYTFTAMIQNAGGGGAFVEVPFQVEQEFGSKRLRVRAMIAGVPYRGILTRMGTDCNILGIRKEKRIYDLDRRSQTGGDTPGSNCENGRDVKGREKDSVKVGTERDRRNNE